MSPPKILVARPRGPSEAMQVRIPPETSTGTRRHTGRPSKPRSDAPRQKIVVRRLPPGLTQSEFELTIGDEWRSQGGKVDYFNYKIGKVTKEASGQSRSSRAYFHLQHAADIQLLAAKIQQSVFTDAKGTSAASSYIGPPVVEFAPFQRIPKLSRVDARQGTIDQDEEFIAFLEQLTNPLPAKTAPETETKAEKVTTTPLIQYLKDRKAARAKAKEHGKSSKASRQEQKDARKEKEKRADKSAAVKKPVLLQKQEASGDPKGTHPSSKALPEKSSPADTGTSKQEPKKTKDKAAIPAERRKERGSALSAAQILQRDLGIGQANPKRARRRESTTKKSEGSKTDSVSVSATPASMVPDLPSASVSKTDKAQVPSSDPIPALVHSDTTTTNPTNQRQPKADTAKSSTPTRSSPVTTAAKPATPSSAAFLRNVDSAKGVTEALVRTAFAGFGTITRLDIDFGRGFANLDFDDPLGLQAAIASSPVPVADAKVTVVERRTRGEPNSRGRGRGRGAPRGRPRGRGQSSTRGSSQAGGVEPAG